MVYISICPKTKFYLLAEMMPSNVVRLAKITVTNEIK